jgi:hypothetical protein
VQVTAIARRSSPDFLGLYRWQVQKAVTMLPPFEFHPDRN